MPLLSNKFLETHAQPISKTIGMNQFYKTAFLNHQIRAEMWAMNFLFASSRGSDEKEGRSARIQKQTVEFLDLSHKAAAIYFFLSFVNIFTKEAVLERSCARDLHVKQKASYKQDV